MNEKICIIKEVTALNMRIDFFFNTEQQQAKECIMCEAYYSYTKSS